MPALALHVRDRGAHHAGAQHHDLLDRRRLQRLRPPARALHGLQVEEERLDHVLGHLAGHQVHEVAALDLQGDVEADLRALDRRGHDVVRRRVVRALDLLAQVRGERGQVGGELRVRRRAARDLVALDVPRLDGLGVLRDPLLRGGHELVPRRDHLVHEPHLQSRRRTVTGPEEQELHQRVGDAEHAHGARHAAGAREQTELHLREAEHGLGVVDDHAVMRGEADLQPATQRRAVDGRDDRLAERLQTPQVGLDVAHHLRDLGGVLAPGLLQIVQVTAGEERLLGGRDDDARDRVLLGLEALDGRVHRRLVGVVHGVGGLVRIVQREDDDPVGVLLPADRRHQTRSTTVAMPMPPPMHSVARP